MDPLSAWGTGLSLRGHLSRAGQYKAGVTAISKLITGAMYRRIDSTRVAIAQLYSECGMTVLTSPLTEMREPDPSWVVGAAG